MKSVWNITLRRIMDNSVNLRETFKSRLDLAAFLLHNVHARIDRDLVALVAIRQTLGKVPDYFS